jgi:D-tyrosyl-tRNA(Tyr) deacylase
MKVLIQRVSHAQVDVNGETIGAIDQGILALIGVEKTDTEASADKLIHKLLNYRIFGDENGKMNLSVSDIQGGLLLVSQFTLVADTAKGLRPGFSKGATPEQGEKLYRYFVDRCREQHQKVETGQFAADMKITLLNDGPVTFLLEA